MILLLGLLIVCPWWNADGGHTPWRDGYYAGYEEGRNAAMLMSPEPLYAGDAITFRANPGVCVMRVYKTERDSGCGGYCRVTYLYWWDNSLLEDRDGFTAVVSSAGLSALCLYRGAEVPPIFKGQTKRGKLW